MIKSEFGITSQTFGFYVNGDVKLKDLLFLQTL